MKLGFILILSLCKLNGFLVFINDDVEFSVLLKEKKSVGEGRNNLSRVEEF